MRVDVAGWQRFGTHGDHRAFLRLFERAETLGYDGTWFNEFHFHRTELPYPDPLLLAAAIFGRTERLRVGMGVILLPFHHPLLLAERVLQVDHQSYGRLDLGLGRGTASVEHFKTLGISLETSRARFAEAYDVLLQGMSHATSSASGEFWQFSDVPVGPAPIQQPHPPIYFAGYTKESIAFAVERRIPMLLSVEPPEERQLALVRACAEERGLPYDSSAFSHNRHVCIAPTMAEAMEKADELRPRLNQRRLTFAAQRHRPVADVELRSREDFLKDQAVVGDPEACIAQMAALARAGVRNVRLVFNGNGELSLEETLRGMELFAREVLPACRTM